MLYTAHLRYFNIANLSDDCKRIFVMFLRCFAKCCSILLERRAVDSSSFDIRVCFLVLIC